MHPFKFIDEKYYNRIIFLTLLLCFLTMVGLQWSELPLQNSIAPKGIVSFELAGDLDAANLIVDSWSRSQVLSIAGFNIGLDYLFLLFYPILLGCVVVVIANGLASKPAIQKIGYVVAWIVILAGVLDSVENIALINILTGTTNETWPVLAFYFASTKFIFVGIGILYIIVAGITRAIIRALS